VQSALTNGDLNKKHTPKICLAVESSRRDTPETGAQLAAEYGSYSARDLADQIPPPYSVCSYSEPGPSRLGACVAHPVCLFYLNFHKGLGPSVVDTYPFAKGYAPDIGMDIDVGSIDSHPFAKGAFGDVRRASLRNGTRVAIKCLRFYTSARDTGRHRLEKVCQASQKQVKEAHQIHVTRNH
jgi:hypothetical protein